jgi:hypothetical protein
MDHCMITALSPQGKSNSYMSAENFVTALLDKISIADPLVNTEAAKLKEDYGFIPPPENLDEYVNRIKQTKVISAELQRTILQFAYEAKKAASATKDLLVAQGITNTISAPVKSEMQIFREQLQQWYDMNSDRLTGTLKRKVLPVTIIVAAIVTIGLNVDTLLISKYLYQNKDVAAKVADAGVKYMKEHKHSSQDSTSDLIASIDSLKAALPAEIPWGWEKDKRNWKEHVWGWIASILAIIMGAPFWFDLLNKVANLRNSGPKPAVAEYKNNGK